MPYDRFKHHRRSIRLKGYDYSQNGAYFVTFKTQENGAIFGVVVDGVMILNEPGRMIETVWMEIPVFYPGICIDAFQIMPNHFHGIIIIDYTDIISNPAQSDNPGNLGDPENPKKAGKFEKAEDPERAGDPVRATPRGCPFPKSIQGNSGIYLSQGDLSQGDLGRGQVRGPAPTGPAPTGFIPSTPTQRPGSAINPGNSGINSESRLSLPDVVHRFKTMTTKRYADGVKNNGWPPFPGRLWQRNYYERIIRNQNEFDRIRHYIINNPANWNKDIEHPSNPGATIQVPDDICKEV
jgi:REP element-mobilizing transposase RayT